MQDLYSRILNMNPATTSQTHSVQTQQQNRSPEFEATSRQFIDMLNQLSANTTGAYQNKQNTYTDLIKSLSDLYGARGSAAAGSTQASALASGLTPLEASGAGNNALLANLQQFFPALAGLRGEAADVGIANQAALQGIQQQLNLPFISNVLAPYQQNVAGQVTTGNSTQTTTDPMAKMNILAQLSQAMESSNLQRQSLGRNNALGWAQLQAQQQNRQNDNLINQQQFGATQQQAQQTAQGNWANVLAQIALQGQNSMGTARVGQDTQLYIKGIKPYQPRPAVYDTISYDSVSGGGSSSRGGGNYYGPNLNFLNSNFGPYYSGM